MYRTISILLFILAAILSCTTKDKYSKLLIEYGEQDSLKQEALTYILENIYGAYSFDTTYLLPYKSLLLELDSLRREKGLDIAYNIINEKWSNSYSRQNIYLKPINDTSIVTENYLEKDINLAFETWNNSIFKDNVDFETFKCYLLPYRIRNGYVIEDWRSLLFNRLETYYNKYPSAIETIDSVLNLFNDYRVSGRPITEYPFLRLSDYEKVKDSKCSERCWFNAMIFRSLGIPCAIDFVPAWGNRNFGHEWNALIMNGKTYPFEATGGGKGKWKPKWVYNNEWIDEYWMTSRLPKVFRFTYDLNKNGPDVRTAPNLFKNRNYLDVSSEYFKTTDVIIENKYVKSLREKYAYLCVFNENKWKPVFWGEKKEGREYEFKDMGRNQVYLPVFYEEGTMAPLNDPFILDTLGNIRFLKPSRNSTEQVTVIRKYLTRPDLHFWRKWNLGAYFEMASNRNFKNAKRVFTIDTCEMHPIVWSLDEPVRTRFLRYVFSDNYDSLAELYVLSKDSSGSFGKVEKKIMHTSLELDRVQVNKLFDNDVLTFASFSEPPEVNKPLWVGLDFGKEIQIDALGICPRNDKNNIMVGLEYELFYWNNNWISLGKKTSKENQLIYNSVPKNSLMLLKCTTEGNENRIFTWENNRQIWW